jgi:hypothetical protein
VPDYLCLIFDRDDGVIRIETLSADEDAQASAAARKMAQGNENARGFELWLGGRKVDSVLTKRTSPWARRPALGQEPGN